MEIYYRPPATSIHFDRYFESKLAGILEDWVRWALRESAITTEQLESIADATAGDAQVVIGTLRAAACRAIKDGPDRITDDHKIEGLREDILMGETCGDGCGHSLVGEPSLPLPLHDWVRS